MKSFREKLYEHHSQTFSVDAVLYEGKTAFQDVLIFENRVFGRVLVLDGIVQLTERDNFIYHEMIVHVPMLAHGAAKRVLIIGGGDGGTLKEVLKHPVEEAVMVEIDGEVIDVSKRFLPDVSGGAFDDPRATVIVGDGIDYVAKADKTFDAIIIDSTDPVGPGTVLFTPEFYRRCRRLLTPGGVITVQSGAPFFHPRQLQEVIGNLSSSFEAVMPYLAPVPTYAGGSLALVAGGPSRKGLRPPKKVLRGRFDRLDLNTRYYRPAVHRAAFTLPPLFKVAAGREEAPGSGSVKTAEASETETAA